VSVDLDRVRRRLVEDERSTRQRRDRMSRDFTDVVADARLEARPVVRTCIACASSAR
jgi:hypothetical protein